MSVNFNEITAQWERDGVPMKRNEQELLTDVVRLMTLCEKWLRAILSMLVAIAIGMLGILGMMPVAHADELDVVGAMAQVNRLLGTDVQEMPQATLVDELPDHWWGGQAGGVLMVSREAPDVCRPLILGHEAAHYVTIKADLLHDVPTDAAQLKAAMDVIARKVEQGFEPWAPQCFEGRGL